MAAKLQAVLEGGDGVTMLTEALRQALKGEGRSHDALKRLIQEVCVHLVDQAAPWPLMTPPLPSLHPPNPCPEPKPRVLPTSPPPSALTTSDGVVLGVRDPDRPLVRPPRDPLAAPR